MSQALNIPQSTAKSIIQNVGLQTYEDEHHHINLHARQWER